HLGRHEVDVEPAKLLEIRPLGDLHPVAPDLPAEPPGAESRLLPVVLDETDVVAAQVDPDRLERGEIEVEHLLRGRLQHHLILEVVLEAVWVLAVASVERTDDGLDVGGLPRLRTEAA